MLGLALFVRFSEMDLSTRFRRARGRRGAGEDADVDAAVDADRRMRVTFMVVGVVRDERRVGSCGLEVILRVRAVSVIKV